uniref:Uncharacterized protein n=1 Tax=Arundo donax TaxID=35708 RepID=A0A0A9A5M2_ARUDO
MVTAPCLSFRCIQFGFYILQQSNSEKLLRFAQHQKHFLFIE